jgi:hypothetical protein
MITMNIKGLTTKKYCFTIMLMLIFSTNIFCSRDFVEKLDYFVEFQEKSPEMASILHVNFINITPESRDAENIVKQQLKIYGNAIIASEKVLTMSKNEIKHKNIIGSAWSNKINLTKIKFQNDLSAYVWLGKTRTVVTFHDYISFLKKEKINRNSRKDTSN